MKKNVFLLISCLIAGACNTQKTAEKTEKAPACITKKIETFSKGVCEKGVNVKEYTFQGIKVFLFDPGTCGNDMTSEVLDQNCKSLGFLGGFAGNIKINGEDFSHAVLIKTIWEK